MYRPAPLSGAEALFGFQKDWIEPHRDNVTGDFAAELYLDPVLARPAGPEWSNVQLPPLAPVIDWISSLGAELPDVDFVSFRNIAGSHGDSDTERFNQLVVVLEEQYRSLTNDQRAGVVFMHNNWQGALVHGLALMVGALSADEFAAGVAAAHRLRSGIPDVGDDDHTEIYQALRADAHADLGYVAAYRKGTAVGRLAELLARSSEDTDLEFKSTLRFDIKASIRNSPEITKATLKTIAAFLNTHGGTLVIGVNDDRKVIGIELDGFASDEKFLLHLRQMMDNHLRPTALLYVVTDIAKVGDKTVCLVTCEPSSHPVVFTNKDGSEQFFVRDGPRTVTLKADDVGIPRVSMAATRTIARAGCRRPVRTAGFPALGGRATARPADATCRRRRSTD